jgi:hypothetical protein
MGDPHTLQYPDSEHKSEVRVTQIHERTERSLLDQNHIFSQTSFLQQQQLQQSQQSQPQQHCNSQLILGMESVGLGLGVGGETEAHMQSLIPTQYDYTATDYSNYNSFPDYSQSMEQIPIQVDPSTNPSMLYTHHNPNMNHTNELISINNSGLLNNGTGGGVTDLTRDSTLNGLNPTPPHPHPLIDLASAAELAELPPALYSHHGYWPPPPLPSSSSNSTSQTENNEVVGDDPNQHLSAPQISTYEHYYSTDPQSSQSLIPPLTETQLLDPGMPLSQAAVVLSQVAVASLGDLSEHQYTL